MCASYRFRSRNQIDDDFAKRGPRRFRASISFHFTIDTVNFSRVIWRHEPSGAAFGASSTASLTAQAQR